MAHAYPEHLATFVAGAWPDGAEPLPPPRVLEHILSIAYQASLLRDEARAVTFRILVAAPSAIPADGGPPDGLHRLQLDAPRPFVPHELRRLAPAARYERALLAVEAPSPTADDRGEEMVIWGLLQSGSRWAEQVGNAAVRAGAPPGSLVVLVQGPGRVSVACGETTLAEIRGGVITGPAFDVFESRWLAEHFAPIRDELMDIHEAEASRSAVRWRPLDPEVIRLVSQSTLRRSLAAIRESQHGGTLLWVSSTDDAWRRFLQIKYPFRDDAGRRRYRSLMLRRMRWLAGPARQGADELNAIDEGIAEMGHLTACLAGVDGAVVLTGRFELLGFGAEITGVPPITKVSSALDLEGGDTVVESMDAVGTRHRAAYRFCAAVPDAIAAVVSQDGGIQFVANRDGEVVRWEHTAVGSIEV